ncbi:hypothetical protein [Streptomyces xanthophaeus]|uniref:hypothetical protein n=1 Tax=Streptomyces xanthophaeus TaxID=67385 RepID=UPI0026480D9C|nr:hypothetical protein [Streptomyces xanthophaeus]WKD31980.1 hypothetical protein KO717_08470 [Streptomyces xanthophaeus]
MTMPPRSKSMAVRMRCRGALTVMAAVLSLAACDPAAPATTPSTSAAVTVGASPSPSPSVVPADPSPSASPTPAADPTTAAPTPQVPVAEPTTKAPEPTKAAPAPPAPTRTRTQAPAPEPTKASTDCYPRSNAGNCYRAGQICRKADVGTSGRDANGRTIHCRDDDSVGQRWGY